MDTTAASRQAAPMLQSKTNISVSMACTIAALPTISARLWASGVSVSEAAPSRRLLSAGHVRFSQAFS